MVETADPKYKSFLGRTDLGRWSAYCLLTACEILNSVFSRGLLSASLTWYLAFANRLPHIGQSCLALTSLLSLQVDFAAQTTYPPRMPSASLDPGRVFCSRENRNLRGRPSSDPGLITLTSSMNPWLLTSPL